MSPSTWCPTSARSACSTISSSSITAVLVDPHSGGGSLSRAPSRPLPPRPGGGRVGIPIGCSTSREAPRRDEITRAYRAADEALSPRSGQRPGRRVAGRWRTARRWRSSAPMRSSPKGEAVRGSSSRFGPSTVAPLDASVVEDEGGDRSVGCGPSAGGVELRRAQHEGAGAVLVRSSAEQEKFSPVRSSTSSLPRVVVVVEDAAARRGRWSARSPPTCRARPRRRTAALSSMMISTGRPLVRPLTGSGEMSTAPGPGVAAQRARPRTDRCRRPGWASSAPSSVPAGGRAGGGGEAGRLRAVRVAACRPARRGAARAGADDAEVVILGEVECRAAAPPLQVTMPALVHRELVVRRLWMQSVSPPSGTLIDEIVGGVGDVDEGDAVRSGSAVPAVSSRKPVKPELGNWTPAERTAIRLLVDGLSEKWRTPSGPPGVRVAVGVDGRRSAAGDGRRRRGRRRASPDSR